MSENKVVTIGKVFGGEFIIGKKDGNKLIDVYSLILIPTQNNQINTLIAPVMMPIVQSGAVKEVSLDKCITDIPAPDMLAEKYTELVSGIIIPQRSGIELIKG